jgi:hypothetical protein
MTTDDDRREALARSARAMDHVRNMALRAGQSQLAVECELAWHWAGILRTLLDDPDLLGDVVDAYVSDIRRNLPALAEFVDMGPYYAAERAHAGAS